MAKTNGWICLHRKMLDTSWYGNTACRSIAVHLLLSATHKDIHVMLGTRQVKLLRGQYITGRRKLAKELGMRVGAVRGALEALEKDEFITRESTHICSIVTICNYNAYQSSTPDVTHMFANRGVPDSQQGGPTQPSEGSQLTTKQQLNKLTNKQYIAQAFEELWLEYPKKLGKKQAQRHFMASVTSEEDVENARQALINYKNSRYCIEEEGRYIKHGSTWFNNWADWITNPEVPYEDPQFAKIKQAMDKENDDGI